MQTISRRRIADYIAQQLHLGANTKHLAKMTAAYLVTQRQTKQLDLLVRDIEGALLDQFGVVSTQVTSARALSNTQRDNISAFVREIVAAKKVIITEETIDSELLGGVTITTPEGFFDGSVRKKIQQLKNATRR